MRIEINEEEIKVAIIEYVSSQGFSITAGEAVVELKAGRGENGMTASISVSKGDLPPVSEVTPIKTETGNIAKEEPKDSKKLPFGKNAG